MKTSPTARLLSKGLAASLSLTLMIGGCAALKNDIDESSQLVSTEQSASSSSSTTSESSTNSAAEASSTESSASTTSSENSISSSVQRSAITNSTDGEHAIEHSAESAHYSHVDVTKTGEADGDEADFYGANSAIFATDAATIDLDDITVTTNGTHANAVFSYGEESTINVSNSTINTSGNCSGGLMVTGGGTLNASDLTIHTTGNSSAAIRSDRGGGTETVTGGSYTTDGTGSPVIYSTADVTVSNATLNSTASQGVVVEGKNSVSLINSDLTASNTTKNSDKSDYYQAVMIYQSMSGDAAQGEASFSMDGGSLTNKNGDIFFVNNTVANISLTNASITNEDEQGVFLRAAAAGWGSEGSNGGHVTLNASKQSIQGNLLVDAVSSLNLYLDANSDMTAAINPDGQEGEVYVDLSDGATWTLTADSYITSLSCSANAINLNGHTLYVNGEVYQEGSTSTGEAIVVEVSSNSGHGGDGGMGGTPPEGGHGPGSSGSGSGTSAGAPSGEPPAKPEG
ncbi:MAG: hypothetical protein IJ125_03535 [Atopobiaceae bacterium]|nr:hypothetical protein [Atopobiaceae bacterium]